MTDFNLYLSVGVLGDIEPSVDLLVRTSIDYMDL